MATITAAAAGNWSAGATWNGGVVPGNGDTADLNGYVVVMDIATLPASGTLLALVSPAKAGQLTVNLATLGDCAINATTITCGTVQGLILVSGAAPTKTLTINGNITGGSGYPAYGLYHTSTGSVAITGNITGGSATTTVGVTNYSTGSITVIGNITGGSGTAAYGLRNQSTGPVTITGNITGGSAPQAFGLYSDSTGIVALNTCNLINGTGAVAYAGKPPTWNLNANNYLQWGAVYFAQQLLDHQILTGVVNGTITGNRVDCPVAKAIESSGNYGDPASPFVGTYHEADVSEVKDGVMFGALSVLEGTYDPAYAPSHMGLVPLGTKQAVV